MFIPKPAASIHTISMQAECNRRTLSANVHGGFPRRVDLGMGWGDCSNVNRLETETRNGGQGRLADHLTRMDFVILDR